MPYEKFPDGAVKCIADEVPFELPQGWAWARVGSVFLTVTGSTPSTQDTSLYGTEYPFYKPTDLDAGFKVSGSESCVSEKGYLLGRALSKHSVLVTCIGATIGKTGYIRSAGICNQQINAILPNENIFSAYTYFCMCTEFEQQQMRINSSATTLPILSKRKFDNLLFPIPPKRQQKEIVARVEKLLRFVAEIQCEKASLQETIRTAKSKILDVAIRGKLVPQNPNDEPAPVLLERIRAEKEELIKQGKIKRDKKESVIFKGEDNSYYDGIPESWAETSLISIAEIELGKMLDAAKNTGEYYPYLRSVNIKWNDIDLSDLKTMKFEPEEFERYTVRKDDLLICEGGDVGRCCIWNSDTTILYQNALHRVRFYSGCNPKFFLYFMMHLESIGYLKKISNGVTIKHLTKKILASIPFLLPPLAEQNRIVATIETYFSYLDQITESLV